MPDQPEDLSGRVAIVTGGGRGLGRAMALSLGRAGAKVVIVAAREKNEVAAVAADIGDGRGLPIVADVSDAEACKQVVEATTAKFGRVDILINNAGRGMRYVSEAFMTEPTKFWSVPPQTWKMVIDTNVTGPFLMARAVAPLMIAAGWGRIVNISMAHQTMRRAGFSPYGPSKAALESETIIWAQDLDGTGVTVNALLPGGATLTGMIPDSFSAELRAKLLAPEIMVAPLLWLASHASDGVTGKRIDASRWRSDLAPADAAKAAMDMAGWA